MSMNASDYQAFRHSCLIVTQTAITAIIIIIIVIIIIIMGIYYMLFLQ